MVEHFNPLGEKSDSPDVLPSEIANKGLVDSIKYLYAASNVQTIGLRRHIPDKEGGWPDLPRGVSETGTATIEANAIAGHIIRDVWPEIHTWIAEHSGGVAEGHGVNAAALYEMDEKKIRTQFLINPETGFKKLRVNTLSTCLHFMHKEFDARMRQGDPAVARLNTLLRKPAYTMYGQDPRVMIQAGFITAADVVWGIFNTLPKVYKQQHRREMTATDFRAIMPSAKNFALAIAGADLRTLNSLQKVLEGESYQMYVATLEMQGLCINESRGIPQLDMTPEALQEFAKNYIKKAKSPSVRTGCPALAVPGQEGPNVVSEFFDWARGLTEKYYLPTLDKKL